MKLSVVIGCLNEYQVIHQQLDAFAQQKWSQPWELIIADNGSTDGTLEKVRSYKGKIPNLRIVDASSRRGVAYARNAGCKVASGESVAFCDADDVVGEGWVAAMGEAVDRLDFVACRVDFSQINPPWALRSRTSTQYHGLQKHDYPPYLDHAGGATLAIKKHIHDRIGGFDETLLSLEDTDYCWRVQLEGVKLHFVPEAVLHVRLRSSLSAMCRQSRRWAEYNVLLYKIYRARGMPPIPWHIGPRIWLHLLRRCPALFSETARPEWLWEVNWALGRLIGSLKHRVYGL